MTMKRRIGIRRHASPVDKRIIDAEINPRKGPNRLSVIMFIRTAPIANGTKNDMISIGMSTLSFRETYHPSGFRMITKRTTSRFKKKASEGIRRSIPNAATMPTMNSSNFIISYSCIHWILTSGLNVMKNSRTGQTGNYQ